MVNVPWCHDCDEPLGLCKCAPVPVKPPKLHRIPLTEDELREIRRQISLENAYLDSAYYSARDKLDRALLNIHKQR